MLYKLTDNQKLAQIYADTADVIEKHGHVRHRLVDSEGRMCISGAISYVVDGDAVRYSSTSIKALTLLGRFTGENPVTWNNREGRTKKEVVNLLRHAATVLNGE